MTESLVTADWLESHLHDPQLVVLDCSWHLPETGRDARDDYRQGHVPGARFFDLNLVSDPDSPYANMLPTASRFATEAGRLGISNNTTVVVYDATYVSARVWWMFRVFGHDKAKILDGGWRGWQAEGRPVETGEGDEFAPARFAARPRQGMVAGWRDVLEAVETGSAGIADARTPGRFTGQMPSGYPGVPGGHMPGAKNIPWSELIEQSGGFRFADPARAEQLFRDAGIDPDKPVIATCGSGVTAAIIGFQLERMGRHHWKLYDGSWHEWGQRADLPKLTE